MTILEQMKDDARKCNARMWAVLMDDERWATTERKIEPTAIKAQRVEKRRRAVAALLADGITHAQIAKLLDVSRETVKHDALVIRRGMA